MARRGPGRPPKGAVWDETRGEYVHGISPPPPRQGPPPPSPIAVEPSRNSREVNAKTIRVRRGRGRPPKGTAWDGTLGEYVRRTQPQSRNQLPPPPSMTPITSWNSEEMNEIIALIGPRQGPYRRCTQYQRDMNGLYKDDLYAEQVRTFILYVGVLFLPHLPTAFIRTSNGTYLTKDSLYSILDLLHKRAATSQCGQIMIPEF